MRVVDPEVKQLKAKLAAAPPPGKPYARPVPGTEREGRSPTYRHIAVLDGPLQETVEPHLTTLHDLFEEAWHAAPNDKSLGWRPWNAEKKTWDNQYTWMTYGEVAERRKNLGAGIVELLREAGGSGNKQGVGIWSQNRPEWQISELALISQSLYPVTLYETLGPGTTEYIINHGQLSCILCSLNHVPTLLKLASRTPTVKIIISFDSLDDGDMAGYSKKSLLNEMGAEVGIKVLSMTEVEAMGQRSNLPIRPPTKDDILTINYTSGTTGDPKGVVLTHRNAVAALCVGIVQDRTKPGDVHISYLPLAHIYGRVADQLSLVTGAAIGYFRGDITGLVDDMKILQPTAFFSVPRLYSRFTGALTEATIKSAGVKGALSRHIINSKKASMTLPPGKATNKHLLYDRIWTSKVRAGLGLQRTRSMISGGALLDPDVHTFLRAALGNDFQQGFGMTETYAGGMLQHEDDMSLGNNGGPSISVEICLESVPDLDYLVTDKPRPRGELLMRGPIMFREYYKNEAETQRAVDPDGWFHTGDIAEIDELGRVTIIDRKKNVLKLAQGEYVSPERIEAIYTGATNLLTLAFVHGDAKESTLVAVAGIDPVAFAPYASKILGRTISATDIPALKSAANDAQVRSAFLKLLDKIGTKAKMNSYEKVKNVYLDVEPLTVANELMTPSLKIKRPQTARAFRKEIDQMYAEIQAREPVKAKL